MSDRYMDLAYHEAEKAFLLNEVPVGACIVCNGEVIAKKHNTNLKSNCACNHAEMLAIIEASHKLNNWRLNNCEMYVTLEPCPMCAGAILQSRIKKLYIGAESNIKSNKNVLKSILQNQEYYHDVEISYLDDDKCSKILSQFFANKR